MIIYAILPSALYLVGAKEKSRNWRGRGLGVKREGKRPSVCSVYRAEGRIKE